VGRSDNMRLPKATAPQGQSGGMLSEIFFLILFETDQQRGRNINVILTQEGSGGGSIPSHRFVLDEVYYR